MDTALQSLLAFHLTGHRDGSLPGSMEGLRPVLFARLSRLTSLRYDFPIVLVDEPTLDVRTLTRVVDELVARVSTPEDRDRIHHHAIRVEREIRALVTKGAAGRLSELWDAAATRLAPKGGNVFQDSLTRLRGGLVVDGETVDCDARVAGRVVHHVWRATQAEKERRFRVRIDGLLARLRDILTADEVRSDVGRRPERLRSAIGGPQAELFDFGALSRILVAAVPQGPIPTARRERLERLIHVLETQRFFGGANAYTFAFASCAEAVEAWRTRMPQAIDLIRALTIAELEIDGTYREDVHDALFGDYGAGALGGDDLVILPDYLVDVDTGSMSAEEHATLLGILSVGFPMKILVRVDDLLERSPLGSSDSFFGLRSRQLAITAMSSTGAFVLQASASALPSLADRIRSGLCFAGPALFTVYSGSGGRTGELAPYLVAAAATESRVFPTFVYDPSAGSDWASRFSLGDNTQVDGDWPEHEVVLEEPHHGVSKESVAFTLLDFASLDARCAHHFARVPDGEWNGTLTKAPLLIATPRTGLPETVPILLMVDGDHMVQRVAVDDALVREGRRCRDMWRSLRELCAIHNPLVERSEQEHIAAPELGARESTSAAPPAPIPEQSAGAQKRDDAYIETPRCTTCNECTQINPRMFQYNENKQAVIADADAGTYAQLVEAAESCKVSIIHPGKPRKPNEPGLEALVERARPFL